MRLFRIRILIAGIIFAVATVAFLTFQSSGLAIARAMSNDVACYVPIVLDLTSTACFAVYTITRPYTENWFPRTLAVLVVGGFLALVWFGAWHPTV